MAGPDDGMPRSGGADGPPPGGGAEQDRHVPAGGAGGPRGRGGGQGERAPEALAQVLEGRRPDDRGLGLRRRREGRGGGVVGRRRRQQQQQRRRDRPRPRQAADHQRRQADRPAQDDDAGTAAAPAVREREKRWRVRRSGELLLRHRPLLPHQGNGNRPDGDLPERLHPGQRHDRVPQPGKHAAQDQVDADVQAEDQPDPAGGPGRDLRVELRLVQPRARRLCQPRERPVGRRGDRSGAEDRPALQGRRPQEQVEVPRQRGPLDGHGHRVVLGGQRASGGDGEAVAAAERQQAKLVVVFVVVVCGSHRMPGGRRRSGRIAAPRIRLEEGLSAAERVAGAPAERPVGQRRRRRSGSSERRR
mmetsp:Transcript_1124/g.2651  ORF Transcript_1124/g.2651 Transcript_1124/m.2651 type:complete len:360 (+) Transcript_1124:794-1873(+)